MNAMLLCYAMMLLYTGNSGTGFHSDSSNLVNLNPSNKLLVLLGLLFAVHMWSIQFVQITSLSDTQTPSPEAVYN